MIILRQKHYNDEESSTGRKILKGALALGATAGTFYGARKGMLGNTMQMHANTLYGKAGVQMQRLGNKIGTNWQGGADFFAKRGNNMVNSAAKEWSLASGQKAGKFVEGATKANTNELIKGVREFKTGMYKDYGGGTKFKYDAESGITPSAFSKHYTPNTTQRAPVNNNQGYSMTANDSQYYNDLQYYI